MTTRRRRLDGRAARMHCQRVHAPVGSAPVGGLEHLWKALWKSPVEGVGYPDAPADMQWEQALIIAPPLAQGSPWMGRFEPYRTAFASGWMAIRGTRRRRNFGRGFVLSDHADWDELNRAIDASGANEVRARAIPRRDVRPPVRPRGVRHQMRALPRHVAPSGLS